MSSKEHDAQPKPLRYLLKKSSSVYILWCAAWSVERLLLQWLGPLFSAEATW